MLLLNNTMMHAYIYIHVFSFAVIVTLFSFKEPRSKGHQVTVRCTRSRGWGWITDVSFFGKPCRWRFSLSLMELKVLQDSSQCYWSPVLCCGIWSPGKVILLNMLLHCVSEKLPIDQSKWAETAVSYRCRINSTIKESSVISKLYLVTPLQNIIISKLPMFHFFTKSVHVCSFWCTQTQHRPALHTETVLQSRPELVFISVVTVTVISSHGAHI